MKRLKRVAAMAAQIAMLVQTVFWVVSALLRALSMSGAMDAVLAALMLADGAAFAVLACLIKKPRRLLKIATLAFLSVNLVLTFTDQMGIWDWIVLGLNIIALGGAVVSYWPDSHQD